jgi:arylsulfotransferase ASST
MRALKLIAATAATTLLATPAVASASGAFNFVSAPRLHPPRLRSDAPVRKGLAPGLFFLANFRQLASPLPMVGQSGPLIVDSHLQPVWFQAVSGLYTMNLRPQKLDGKPVLSWWQGKLTKLGVVTQGEDIIVGQDYKQIADLKGQDGWIISPHELIISGHEAWVTAYRLDASTGVLDSAVQEYDLSQPGLPLVFTWSALAHIPTSQSHQTKPAKAGQPWDAYHANSIQLVGGGAQGRFLVSMRNTWGAYLVDIATGNILWTLLGDNGAGSSFTLPKASRFEWQHDVELHSNGLLSLFDDACCLINPPTPPKPSGPSRGLLIRLDMTHHTASFVNQYKHPAIAGGPLETPYQGNADLLPNRNVLVGWGSQPYFSEFSPTGKLLFDAVFPAPDLSYRAYKFAGWVGKPPLAWLHAVAHKHKGKATIYVSWNGATQVTGWRVLAGSDAKHLRTVATVRKSGFETVIALRKAYNTYEVKAIGTKGQTGTFGSGGGGTCNGCGPGGY